MLINQAHFLKIQMYKIYILFAGLLKSPVIDVSQHSMVYVNIWVTTHSSERGLKSHLVNPTPTYIRKSHQLESATSPT